MKVSLEAARVNAKYNQKQVAEAMEVSVNTIIAWEKGRVSPTVAQAEKLCDLYNCTMQDILFA